MHDTDRRVIYTKRILRAALLKLMEEKHVSRISVTELCAAAGVNRGTFYSHYRQPEDVMHQIERDLLDEIADALKDEADMSVQHKKIMNILELNRSACKVLFSENGNPDITNKLLEMSRKYFTENHQSDMELSEGKAAYLHTFVFAGTAQVIKEWLTCDDMRTAEEMADVIYNLQKNMLGKA